MAPYKKNETQDDSRDQENARELEEARRKEKEEEEQSQLQKEIEAGEEDRTRRQEETRQEEAKKQTQGSGAKAKGIASLLKKPGSDKQNEEGGEDEEGDENSMARKLRQARQMTREVAKEQIKKQAKQAVKKVAMSMIKKIFVSVIIPIFANPWTWIILFVLSIAIFAGWLLNFCESDPCQCIDWFGDEVGGILVKIMGAVCRIPGVN